MSWHYLPELAAEYSAGICSDGDVSVLSSTTSTQETSCLQDNATDVCHDSQSGMMCEHSTENRGEAWLMLYQAAFRAKTSPQPEKEQESKEPEAGYGRKWLELSVKYDRDLHSWKTHRCLFDEDLQQSSVILPKWGTMRHGVLFQLRTAERRICESESGLWVGTPTASASCRSESFSRDLMTPAELARRIPTPDANMNRGSRKDPTQKNRKSGAQAQFTLNDYVKMWPTPTVCGNYNRKELSKTSGDGLATAVIYATPCARDWKDNGKSPAELNRNSETLATQAGGKLNPTWVEWLMGWPLGWTDCDALATDKFQSWQQQHGMS